MNNSSSLVQKYFADQHDERVYFWEGPFSPINYTFGWNDQKYFAAYKTKPFSCFVAITGRDSHILFNDVSYSGYGREVFQSFWSGSDQSDKLAHGFQAIKESVQTWYDETVQLDFSSLPEEDILTLIHECADLYGTMFGNSLHVETFDEEIALATIGEQNKDILTHVWEKATHPYFESFDNRRLRYAVSLLEKQAVNKEKLLWFTTTDFFEVKPLSVVTQKLTAIQERLETNRASLKDDAQKRSEELPKYLKWLESLPEKEKRLAQYTQQVMEIRDQRKDPYNQLQTIQSLLGQELLRRAGIDEKFTPYLVSSDLVQGLKTLVTKRVEFPNRPNGFVAFYSENGQITSATENITETLEYIKQKNLDQESKLGVEEIKGLVGCKGFATGTVCLVPDVTRAQHFRDGDVLVTGMTRPEFVPYMKRACAIITDEGGITCHAAIVSRELHIPCLIGTKIATKILRNGDKVEVDANHGIIKILERSKTTN